MEIKTHYFRGLGNFYNTTLYMLKEENRTDLNTKIQKWENGTKTSLLVSKYKNQLNQLTS